MCETGFSFTRGDNNFAPVYFTQDSAICGTKHSPTTVFDDLSAGQAQGLVAYGTTYEYCVSATASIGCDSNQYESDRTCQAITIAWESSVSGWVHGRDNTGKAPVRGVKISWYFINDPSIGGFGTTNDDGHFIEVSTDAIGINIQVCP
jgi:hypothetical protein